MTSADPPSRGGPAHAGTVHVLEESGEVARTLRTRLRAAGLTVVSLSWSDPTSVPAADVRVLLVVENAVHTLTEARSLFPDAQHIRIRRTGVRAVRADDYPAADVAAPDRSGVLPTLAVGRDVVRVEVWPERGAPEAEQLREALAPSQGGSTRLTRAIYVPPEQDDPARKSVMETYASVLHLALERITYRDTDTSRQRMLLRDVARWAHGRRAGAREVVELHTRVLDGLLPELPAGARKPMVEEGRLVVLELMGHLLSLYRDDALKEGTP